MSDIQHKPSYLAHPFGFDEDGERVVIYHPRTEKTPLKLDLLWTLQEMGAVFPDGAAALSAIEKSFEQVALECRLEELRWITDRVGKDSAAGIALEKLFRESVSSLRSPEAKVGDWLDRFKLKCRVNTKRE